jgi:hypothetical protein
LFFSASADRELAFGTGRPIVEGATIAVAADQVAAPVKGGTFTIGGLAHKILSDPKPRTPIARSGAVRRRDQPCK